MQKAIAVLAIAVAAGLSSCGHHTKMARYRDARYGWTISYPASMRRSIVDYDVDMVSEQGVVIASFDGARKRKGFGFRRFPADGVAFGLMQFGGGGPADLSPPEARFPLSRSGFTLSRFTQKPEPKSLEHYMIANGSEFTVLVWFGPKSSREDKERIWQIVRSIRFPPQRTGTMSGPFYVLEDASRYPLNSVVHFPGKLSPEYYVPRFYLVHAPGGLYAVGWNPTFEAKCRMRFDRPTFEFFCTATRGRWDRIGRPLMRPRKPYRRYNNVLDLGQAKIGRDGQVLVGNWSNLGDSRNTLYPVYEHRYWPSGG